MFTGIIEGMATIREKTETGLILSRPENLTDIAVGSSISVSGICLTITECDDASMCFDVVPETWERTTLGTIKEGDHVNLERALEAGGRLDGHIVQGHVEGVGTVTSLENDVLTLEVPSSLLSQTVPKGSIALDGVSLTLAAVTQDQVSVALIPHTLKNTTLGSLQKGDTVNIETDVLVRSLRATIPTPA